MKQTYYIFRHGKAIEDGKEYGDTVLTASLLPESIPVIKKIAAFLQTIPESKNFSSEILRCKQTVDIISSETGKEFVFNSRLNEFYQEEFTDFTKRVEAFLLECCFSQKGPFLICTHAAVIAALKHYIIHGKFDIAHQFDYIQPGEMLVIKEDRKIEVLDFN